LRVLLVTAVLPPRDSPEADYARVTAEDLAARGHQVHVLTGHRHVATVAGATVHATVPSWGWPGLPAVARALLRIKPDVIVLLYLGFLYESHPMATLIPGLARVIRPRAAVVTMISDPVAGAVARRRWRLACRAARLLGRRAPDAEWGWIAAGSDRLTTTSRSRRDDLERKLRGSTTPIDVYPAPVLIAHAGNPSAVRGSERRRLGLQEQEVILIFFGYLYSGKGLETLLDALLQIQGRGRLLRVMVAGGTAELIDGQGYAGRMRARAETLGLADQVMWLGGFESGSDQASRWLSAADVAVFSPGMGIQLSNTSVGAAAAHGLPIVATAGAHTERDIFVDGDSVRLVGAQDPAALAQALEEVAADEVFRRRLGDGATRLAERWYTRDRAASLLEETLRAARGARGSPPPEA
jgi:glycosyltransferase involved in cell wall biosynthesis